MPPEMKRVNKPGKDIDIFWDFFSGAPAEDQKEEGVEGNKEDIWTTDIDPDKIGKGEPEWLEKVEGIINSSEEKDIGGWDWGDKSKEEDSDKQGSESKEDDLNKEDPSTVEKVVDDLIDKVDDKLDTAETDAEKKILSDTLRDLKEAQLTISELQAENETYKNKYLEKFSETSEMSIMKPYIDTIQSDTDLLSLVNSFRSDSEDWKINSLITMVKKTTWVDVSDYIVGKWKEEVKWALSTWSDSSLSENKDSWWLKRVKSSNSWWIDVLG